MDYNHYLSRNNDNFNKTKPAENKNNDIIPAGDYKAIVEEIKLRETKDKSKFMLNWHLSILGPKHINRRLFINHMLEGDNVKYTKAALKIFGYDKTELISLPTKFEERKGKEIDITVEVKEYQDKMDNSMKKVNNVYFKRITGSDNQSSSGFAKPPAAGMPKESTAELNKAMSNAVDGNGNKTSLDGDVTPY